MKELHDDLHSLLADFDAGRFTPATKRIDIFFAYRLLLFRNTEARSAEELETRTKEFPAPHDLTRGFMASAEFRDNYLGVSQRPDGRIVLVREGNLRIAVHLDDLAISGMIINGIYEPETRWLVRTLVKPGQTCVDLGANLGYITVNMADRVGDEGQVYSYEPFPVVHKMLSITVEESGFSQRVSLRQKACSDQASNAKLCYAAQSNNFGGSYVAGDGGRPVNSGLSTVDIETTSLDSDLEDVPRIDFIKMDVEGTEAKALRGMKARLLKDHPVLVMEINPDGLAVQSATVEDVLVVLEEAGYSIYLVTPLYNGEVVEVSSRETQVFAPGTFENVLCLQREQAANILAELLRSKPAV